MEYIYRMPRLATNTDAFAAVAEPSRRAILDLLAVEERSVGEIVRKLGIAQPSVSKHLRVLHEMDLVRARREGRHMIYRTNADALRPLYNWTKTFERYWSHQLGRVKERAEAAQRKKDDRNA